MLRFRHAFGLAAAAIVVASVGCAVNGPEQCCPTDARRIAYSCAGQEAVRMGPCGPNEAYYGHHPTCWGSWPEGWEQYKGDYCVTTAAVTTADCDCEQPEAQVAVPVETLETAQSPEPVEAEPASRRWWPKSLLPMPKSQSEAEPEPQPEPEIEPIQPAPAPIAEPIRQVAPAPALLPNPPTAPIQPTTPILPAPQESAPALETPTASTGGSLPTYEDLLKARPVQSSSRPVFGPPPAPDSGRRY